MYFLEKILDFLEKPGENFLYFSQKKGQFIMEKIKSGDFSSPCAVTSPYLTVTSP